MKLVQVTKEMASSLEAGDTLTLRNIAVVLLLDASLLPRILFGAALHLQHALQLQFLTLFLKGCSFLH